MSLKLLLCMPLLILLPCLLPGCGDKKIYDERQDAMKAYEKMLAKTQPPKEVLLIFGANWCKGCIVLDGQMQQEPLKSFIARHFNLLKVDAGKEGRNQTLREHFGMPAQKGMPAVVIADASGQVRFKATEGEFFKARNLSMEDIIHLLKKRA